MKKIIIPIIISITSATKAQIAISKESVSNNSVSLEFADNENKGLILPYVIDKSSIAENGTIIYDVADHKVKYLIDANVWFDLSIDVNGTADLSIQGDDKIENAGARVSIDTNGDTDSAPNGVLVLADTDKAMVLPKVASPHLNIINPSPGMMAYDTVKKQLAVYNGTFWTFWKP